MHPRGERCCNASGACRGPVPLLMDRAYECDATRELAVELGYVPVVPPKHNRRTSWEYDRVLYKRRNEIERLFRRLKGFRRIFSRFEKLDVMFVAFINFRVDRRGPALGLTGPRFMGLQGSEGWRGVPKPRRKPHVHFPVSLARRLHRQAGNIGSDHGHERFRPKRCSDFTLSSYSIPRILLEWVRRLRSQWIVRRCSPPPNSSVSGQPGRAREICV